MSELEKILAARAKIAEQRKQLDLEDKEYETAERVLRKIAGTHPAEPARGMKSLRLRGGTGLPTNFRNVIDGIRKYGGLAERSDVLSYINARRAEPLAEPSYAARISKMVKAGLIERDGSKLRDLTGRKAANVI
ncbi:hypothetical protein TPR58_05645 [Sphingomonas sp. HF-S3]|uniref:Uncharacterized protein n=1 Tax=Sphingomonas rustica TaxID=3103142 RepID=A0ABV0B4V2_9SPHN